MRPALAILGGTPIRTGGWPAWPEPDPETEAALLDAFRSGRWTITGPGDDKPAWERRFGAAFAEFCETAYGVPTASGSGALTVALAAVGVRAQDEVIVPAITWVAAAASVLALGARPVPADISAANLCISPEAARRAITDRTTAILVVHQNCSVADIHALVRVARTAGIAVVEDCSHAHGARVQGVRVGTFGAVGAFSLQQNKLLACGEGGVAVTGDEEVFRRLQQLRGNGREYAEPAALRGELAEVGGEMGDNLVMSELAAAVALARLDRLEQENARRRAAAEHLDRGLSQVVGVRPVTTARAGDEPTYHKYTVWVEPEAFADVDIRSLARALTAEVGFTIGVLDAPLVGNRLFQPHRSPRVPRGVAWPVPADTDFPVSYAAYRSCLTIRHHALLADRAALDDLVAGFDKVRRAAGALVGANPADDKSLPDVEVRNDDSGG